MHDAPKISRTGAGKAFRLLSSVILAKQSFSTDYSFKPPKTCRRPKKKTMTLKYRHVRAMSLQITEEWVEDHQIRLIAFDIRLASFWAPGDVEGHRLTSEHSMLI